jgi:hypothetical protein
VIENEKKGQFQKDTAIFRFNDYQLPESGSRDFTAPTPPVVVAKKPKKAPS